MIYSKRIKTTMCIAATMTAFLIADFHIADAVSFSTEKGIAGIALSLDKFYNADNKNTLEEIPTDTSISVMSFGVTDVVQNEVTAIPQAEDTSEEELEEVKEEVSKYANVGISIADNYVNIRKKADTESEVLGKLYKGSAATILETEGEWVKIKSGSVTGYINSEFLAIGFEAEELVDKYGTKLATVVNTQTLKVRAKASTESECLTLIPLGETFPVLKEYKEWVKISMDDEEDNIKGFVSKEYVSITVEFEEAISVEEEQAKLAQEEATRKAEQEQLARLESQEAARKAARNTTQKKKTENVSVGEDPSGSGSGSEIASYGLKFVGNPYVYGGTSLTNGADCSGFVQSVYKSFGYHIPRDSRSQAAGAGKKVNLGSLKPGDLVFYTGSSGSVNHVALYIGGGQIVHASNRRTGIKVSNVNYRTPYMARRVVNE